MNNDWYRLGDAQYRKVSIYPNLLWQKNDIKLDNFDKICGSSLGGPIALVKDESTITSQCKWNIQIFSSSGNLMGKVNVASSSHISGLGWNDLEELIIVFEEGL